MDAEQVKPEDVIGPLNDVERRNAPACLYVAGSLELLRRGPRVSVVGSRKPSDEGIARARVVTRALVRRGVVVVSGLAEGIDTAAHETAIFEGGHTVAVLGTPLDKVFPAKNRALQGRLIREQLVVSQFPSGSPSRPGNFPMRNRTMALLTDATFIIEAGEQSGTLHLGWEALRLGRLLFLMESLTKNPVLSWPTEMIRYGAQVLSRENFEFVLDELPQFARGDPVTVPESAALGDPSRPPSAKPTSSEGLQS